jgi:hypothetical protein
MGLVNLSELKAFLGIVGNEKDALLNILIEQASGVVEGKLNRTFTLTTYTQEKYTGSDNKELKLKNFPVVTFSKLEENTSFDNSDNWQEISSSGYWVENETGIITKNTRFRKLTFGYRATYEAGYSYIPNDIQYLVMSLCGYMMNSGKFEGLKSESLGDHSISLAGIIQKDSLLNDIMNRYRDLSLAD